jgi:mannose-6-phosphate isomerase-like protein (cupin superfamily)
VIDFPCPPTPTLHHVRRNAVPENFSKSLIYMKSFELKQQGETLIFPDNPTPADQPLHVGVILAPGADGPPPHIHTQQDEWFEVESGRMVIKINGKEHVLEAGGKICVKAGETHTFKNGLADQPLKVNARFEPARHIEWMLTELAKSAIRNGGAWKNLPLLEGGYCMYELRKEYRLAGIPFWLQDLIFSTLHLLARMTGASKNLSPSPITTKG